MNTKQKVIPIEKLVYVVRELKKQGKKIVTTNGAFDLLHIGHKRALEESKSLGDILVVGINSDLSVKQYKSDLRPIISEADRAEMVAALDCVDYVTIFSESDPIKFLKQIKPDVHTKSGDYKPEELKETSIVRQNGGEVVIIPFVAGKSTTSIIERILKTQRNNFN